VAVGARAGGRATHAGHLSVSAEAVGSYDHSVGSLTGPQELGQQESRAWSTARCASP